MWLATFVRSLVSFIHRFVEFESINSKFECSSSSAEKFQLQNNTNRLNFFYSFDNSIVPAIVFYSSLLLILLWIIICSPRLRKIILLKFCTFAWEKWRSRNLPPKVSVKIYNNNIDKKVCHIVVCKKEQTRRERNIESSEKYQKTLTEKKDRKKGKKTEQKVKEKEILCSLLLILFYFPLRFFSSHRISSLQTDLSRVESSIFYCEYFASYVVLCYNYKSHI